MSTVLVIEDSHELAESLKDILKLGGHTPIIALTGAEGLEIALNKKPDLIMLDIKLPDTTGYEVYSKLREDTWGEGAKVLVLTASDSTDNIAKNIDLPRENILFKPSLSIKDLLEIINENLQK